MNFVWAKNKLRVNSNKLEIVVLNLNEKLFDCLFCGIITLKRSSDECFIKIYICFAKFWANLYQTHSMNHSYLSHTAYINHLPFINHMQTFAYHSNFNFSVPNFQIVNKNSRFNQSLIWLTLSLVFCCSLE